MGKLNWLLAFFALTEVLDAAPRGGVEAKTEQGELTSLGSWWQPAEGYEGRWWRHDSGAGSAWVRAGAFQTGPMIVYSGGEGWRTWSPNQTLSSGHWGVGVDTDNWGVWSVQRPENLEAGAQLKGSLGPWTLAAGGDRTWVMDPAPDDSPWLDRGRIGLSFFSGGFSGGAESTSFLPVVGPGGWRGRGRFGADAGPWALTLKGTRAFGVVETDQDLWGFSTQGGWKRWKLGWKGGESDPTGRYEAGWEESGTGLGLVWGAQNGWEGNGSLVASFEGLTFGAQVGLGYGKSGWTSLQGASAAGRTERGRWMGSWIMEWEKSRPAHSVAGSWKESSLEFEALWTVQGFRLGWMGPGNVFHLNLRWFF